MGSSDAHHRLRAGSVLVTGFSSHFARQVTRRLHRNRRVLAMGPRVTSNLPPDVEHFALDPLRSAARAVFGRKDVGAVVHLGAAHHPHTTRDEMHSRILRAFQRLVEMAIQHRIPKVVLLSSANVYGPRPENAQYLNEQAPLLAGGSFTEMHTLVELDMYAQSCLWRSPEVEIVILRPANILGTVNNAASNYLRLPLATTLMGFDPMVQPVHQEDVVSAIECALEPGIRGVFNIAGPPPVALSSALKLLGRRSVSIPYSLARGGLSGLFRIGVSRFPAPELDFIRYVCMVDDQLARKELSYRPAYDLGMTLKAVDDDRWVG